MTSQPRASGVPWFAVAVLLILVVAGSGLLVYAVLTAREPGAAPAPTPAPATATSQPQAGESTAVSAVQPTQSAAVVIPPVTPLPEASATSTETPVEAATVTATPDLGPVLTIVMPANIRSGPGTNYPVLGGVEAGKTAPVVGRDASSDWYVISYAGSASGQGWVSSIVATYSGDANSLPVVKAPPPPPPTAVPPTAVPTQVPPTAPPPQSARGIIGELRLCEGRTTYAAGERICVIEKIFNSSANSVDYGILGVNAVNMSGGSNWFQSSWTGYGYAGDKLTLDPNCTGPVGRCDGPWEDGFKLSAGTYQFSLSICYSRYTTCQGGGEWETLTTPFTVIVQ